MTTEAQTCALSICVLSTYVLGILRISEWSIILSSPRSYCPVPNAVYGLLSRHGTGDNYKLLVHIFFTLCCRRSTFVERPLQINFSLCKTNPIYWILKMNASSVSTRDYENDYDFRPGKTNPSKPKTKPISEMLEMNVTSVKTKDYRNERLCGLRENKPNQTQFLPGLTETINTCFWLHKDLLRKSLCQNT